jgi:hypothetical protein
MQFSQPRKKKIKGRNKFLKNRAAKKRRKKSNEEKKTNSKFHVRAEVMGLEGEEKNPEEIFVLELDVMGDPGEKHETMSNLMQEGAVGKAVCKTLRPLLVKYIEEKIPKKKKERELEDTENGEKFSTSAPQFQFQEPRDAVSKRKRGEKVTPPPRPASA